MSLKDRVGKYQELSERKRALYKRQAEIAVSFIQLYLANITKSGKNWMLLFERKFIFELLQCQRDVIIQEGSYQLDLNE